MFGLLSEHMECIGWSVWVIEKNVISNHHVNEKLLFFRSTKLRTFLYLKTKLFHIELILVYLELFPSKRLMKWREKHLLVSTDVNELTNTFISIKWFPNENMIVLQLTDANTRRSLGCIISKRSAQQCKHDYSTLYIL